MKDCWEKDPGVRPTFANLRNKMKSFEERNQVRIFTSGYQKWNS